MNPIQQPKLRWTMIFLGIVMLSTLEAFSTPVFSQSGIPKIVTLKNSAQFEGETTSISAYSESVADASPFGQKPIVMVDDGLRRIFFPFKRIAQQNDSDRVESQIPIWQKTWNGDSEGYGLVSGIGPFDENGHRQLRVFTADNGFEEYTQGITLIGPRFCEVQTLVIPRTIPNATTRMRKWTMQIGTNAIPMDILHSVLRKQVKKGNESPNEYLEIVDFFVEAQQYKRAIDELGFILEKFPDLNDQITKDREGLQQVYTRTKVLNEARSRLNVGQSDLAYTLAEVFLKNTQGVAPEIIVELKDIQQQIDSQRTNVNLVRQQVEQLVADVKAEGQITPDQMAIIDSFKNELESELNVDNVSRLDTFTRLAADNMANTEKLALAISGWLMSSNEAIRNFAIVQSMLPVRDLIHEYLTTTDLARREDILREFEKFEAGQPEYMAKIISWMKPTHPPAELENYTGEKPIEFFVEIQGPKANPGIKKYRCLAHVPPQYNPYRQYPCVLTLRPGIELETQLDRYCGSYNPKLGIRTGRAIRNGYIVVAVDWKDPGQADYEYSLREHAIVLKALKKSLQMFSIDSDRVFLTGHSTGATAAYDIGLSHPEHWAGISGIGGLLDRYAYSYSDNRHVELPVYSVIGQKDPAARANKKAWNKWLSTDRYLDCVLVEFKGRGNEPFHEEMPEFFKWAAAHQRILPDKAGFELEFELLRPWDNYFWFWELKGIPEEYLHRPEHWSERHPKNRVKMEVALSQNQPNVFKNVGPSRIGTGGIIWLSPEFVDFKEEIIVQGRGNGFKGIVKPSRRVLLDDLRKRADRKHPYWARIDCDGGRWSVPESEE